MVLKRSRPGLPGDRARGPPGPAGYPGPFIEGGQPHDRFHRGSRMTVSTEPVALLSRTLEQVVTVIARVRPEQAQLPTPCRSWDLRTLVNHVVNDAQKFVVIARGGAWEARQDDVLGDDWLDSFRRPAAELVAAWNQEGALDRTVQF